MILTQIVLKLIMVVLILFSIGVAVQSVWGAMKWFRKRDALGGLAFRRGIVLMVFSLCCLGVCASFHYIFPLFFNRFLTGEAVLVAVLIWTNVFPRWMRADAEYRRRSQAEFRQRMAKMFSK